MKKLLSLLLIPFFLTSCSWFQATEEQSPVGSGAHVVDSGTTEKVKLETESEEVQYFGDVTGLLVRPVDEGSYPAVILIHEWWGVNDDIHQKAEDFAEEGYVALVVDLYNGQSTKSSDEARKLASSVRENIQGAFDNLQGAIDFLKSKDYVDAERLASVGWCFGGGWSYELAKNNLGVKASVIYYGRFNPEDDLEQMRAKIIGHFGEKDTGIKVSDVKQFQATLKTHSGDHEIYIYPNAGHAFASTGNEEAYNAEADAEAWARTMSFLEKHL